MGIFNNPKVLSRSWYYLCKSSAVKRGKAKSFAFFDFKIAVFRDQKGKASALYAYCPHMGVDMGAGEVVAGGLVCPYHKWKFNSDGKCLHIPKRYGVSNAEVTSFPVVEKYGSIWFFNGEKADYPFPEIPWPEKDFVVMALPTQRLKCHPHIVGTNNPDFNHLETIHGLSFLGTPRQVIGKNEITYDYEMDYKPKNWFEFVFLFFSGKIFRFHIRQNGPSNIIMDISSKSYNFNTLISLAPTKNGHTQAKMFLFLPKGSGLRRLLGLYWLRLPLLLASIIKVQTQDLVVYNNIDFILPENEETLVQHKKFIETFGDYHPKKCSIK
jgi:phenylpropionate dioxygenase-like ring-hydroxylating dioxygenase large terminal subunit